MPINPENHKIPFNDEKSTKIENTLCKIVKMYIACYLLSYLQNEPIIALI